jgi:hypothetical protein
MQKARDLIKLRLFCGDIPMIMIMMMIERRGSTRDGNKKKYNNFSLAQTEKK